MAGPRNTYNATASGEGTLFRFYSPNANITGDLNWEFGVDESTDYADLSQVLFCISRGGIPLLTMLRSGALALASSLTAGGAGEFDGDISASGNGLILGTIDVGGNAVLGGTLQVAGAATLASSLAVAASATVGGTLGVGGNATFGGTLAVTGAASFVDANIAGSASFTSSFPVAGSSVVTLLSTGNLLNKRISSYASITSALTVPSGSTGQRPGTPSDGDLRFNSDLNLFEGYYNGTWQSVGGGVHAAKAAQTPADLAALTLGTEGFQKIPVSGAAGGAVQLSSQPFGATAPGFAIEVVLVGQSNSAIVTLVPADMTRGFVGNGICTLTKGSTLTLIYDSVLDRWVEKCRCIIAIA